MLKFRFPDDPVRITHEAVADMERQYPGLWIAQPKGDGWRRPGYFSEGKWTFYAKRGDGTSASKPPDEGLVAEFETMGWPDGIALDMEWMGPRCKDEMKGRHEFWIFDILYHDGKWVGARPFEERLELLKQAHAAARGESEFPNVRLVEDRHENLFEYFAEQRANPLSEGLVLRHRAGKLIGNRAKSVKNSEAMLKVKYRDIKEEVRF